MSLHECKIYLGFVKGYEECSDYETELAFVPFPGLSIRIYPRGKDPKTIEIDFVTYDDNGYFILFPRRTDVYDSRTKK